jgi:SSS family solute:Na+ symporter
MLLSTFDWIVIAIYFVINMAIALYYARRAGGSTNEFFLSGRNAPWWLAGTSMVATTFAADTPLAVTGLVARNGIAGNWFWWSMVMSGMMTVFFYARLWRRAGVMTDVEFSELRYGGKAAAFLRGFRALYFGVPINCIILGWVSLAMLKILRISLGVSDVAAMWILIVMLIYTAIYTTLAGLWGVYVTDVFQFGLKMGMVILLAIYSVKAVGGMEALQEKVAALDATNPGGDTRLAFMPSVDSAWMPLVALCTYLAVTWWSSWYPGAEPGGGGFVAQRIFSAKDERHGVLATLWFNVAHYALRPWPWILTALASIVLYPDLADKEAGYVLAFMDPNVFPTQLRGFMLAGFAAAYMSTIATQLNWGASYVVNDFYSRFVVRNASQHHLVIVSQATTALLMALSLAVTLLLYRYERGVKDAWELLMATGAGTGGVYLLRWYWWRINAWSEVSAMAVAAGTSILLRNYVFTLAGQDPSQFAYLMLSTVAVTTAAWILVTYLTPPETSEKLIAFYRIARPTGPGWTPVAAVAGPIAGKTDSLREQFVNWVLGCVLIYTMLFGTGHVIFGRWALGLSMFFVAFLAAVIVSRSLSKSLLQERDAIGVPSVESAMSAEMSD